MKLQPRSRSLLSQIVSLVFCCLLLCGGSIATAAIFDDGDGDGKWENPLNWDPDGVPGNADLAQIIGTVAQNRTAIFDADTQTAVGPETVGSLLVGDGGAQAPLSPGGKGTLNLSSGVLNVSSAVVGGRGNAGILNQISGELTVSGATTVGFEASASSTRVGSGTYNLSGGELDANGDLYIGRNSAGSGAQSANMTSLLHISGASTLDVAGALLFNVGTTPGRVANFDSTLRVTGSDASISVGNGFNTSLVTETGGDKFLRFDADAAGVSTINVAGAVNTSGALQIDLSTLGSNFLDDLVLIDNDLLDAITGSFATLTGLNGTIVSGTNFSFGSNSFELSYTYDSLTGIDGAGNDLALVNLVPEPSTFAMGIFALLFGLPLMRKRLSGK